MKLHHTLSILTALLIAPVVADTIILKNGDKFEGEVTSEDATSYIAKIQVTKSIKDERKFLKSEVARIIKETLVSKDYKKLGQLIPTPDLLEEKKYNLLISKAQEFIAKHPGTPEAGKTQTSLTILEHELAAISTGGMKLGGKIIDADKMKVNTYEIDAQIIKDQMIKLSRQGKTHLALRKWDELKEDYPHSEAHAQTIPTVTIILKSYSAKLKNELDTVDQRMEKLEKVVMSLDAQDRNRAESTIMGQKAAYEALSASEKKGKKTRWLTTDAFHPDALKSNLRNADSELTSLSRTDSSAKAFAGTSQRGAWTALENGELMEATKHLEKLKSMKLADKYTGPIMTMLSEKKLAAEMAAEKMAEEKRLAEIEAEKAAMAKEEAEKAAMAKEKADKKRKNRKK